MDFCCGIVLYNPDIERLEKNISAIKDQVSTLVLIDNGSKNIDEVKALIVTLENAYIIENSENKGIAYALNQIMDYSEKKGYPWVLSLDQDSVCDRRMISIYKEHIDTNIGIICPKIIDINMQGAKENNDVEEIYDSTNVITSGSFIQVEAWHKVGKYDDRLFIDYVDTEFQERILRNNYKIIRVNNTFIFHEIGRMKEIRLWKVRIYCSNHSAFRRYYMVRNRLYFKRKYFGRKGYLVEKIRLLLGDAKILIFEEEKIDKIIASQRGYRDYRKLMR